MSENKKLEDARKALDDLIEKNPKWKGYQEEVSRRLDKAPGFKAKMDILKFMLAERLQALEVEMRKIGDIAQNVRIKIIAEVQGKDGNI